MILTGPAIRSAVKRGDVALEPFDELSLNPNSYNYHLADTLLMLGPGGKTSSKVSLSAQGYVLKSAIRGWGAFCFIAALFCSVGVIVNRYFEIKPGLAPYLGSVTLSLAIVGVAFRTIQDGLGITKDIERYRDYRGKVRRTLLCFEESADQQKKLRLMEEMELAVVDELRGFLRTHRSAAFVL